MPVPATDPKVQIMGLVTGQWVPANVANTTPDFHTGWWNPKSYAPQVTFGQKAETFMGSSGYYGIEGGGGAPVQVANGQLFVNCWATRANDGTGTNPKKLVHLMADEIRRIIAANYNALSDFDFVSVLGIDEVPPSVESDPLTFRMAVTIGYRWRTTG